MHPGRMFLTPQLANAWFGPSICTTATVTTYFDRLLVYLQDQHRHNLLC